MCRLTNILKVEWPKSAEIWECSNLDLWKMQMFPHSAKRFSCPQRFHCDPNKRVERKVTVIPLACPGGSCGLNTGVSSPGCGWATLLNSASRRCIERPTLPLLSAARQQRAWGRTAGSVRTAPPQEAGCAPNKPDPVHFRGENSRPHQALTRPLRIHMVY